MNAVAYRGVARVLHGSESSQWTRGLRHGSAAARLLGLRVRILPWTWMSVVSVVCFQVEISATS